MNDNLFGFIEVESDYDDTTHAKVIKHGEVREAIFSSFGSEEIPVVVAELSSKNDIPEEVVKQFFMKYEALGFEFYDGSRLSEECQDGVATLIMMAESVSQEKFIEIVHKAGW